MVDSLWLVKSYEASSDSSQLWMVLLGAVLGQLHLHQLPATTVGEFPRLVQSVRVLQNYTIVQVIITHLVGEDYLPIWQLLSFLVDFLLRHCLKKSIWLVKCQGQSNQIKSNKTLLKVDKPQQISQHNKSKQYI